MSELFNLATPETAVPLPDEYTCLLAYRGSIAHGMYVPNTDPNSIDDVDLMGVVIGPPETYFGLKTWESRGTREVKKDKYDVVIYEIRKMFSLLLQGNPNVLGILWTKPVHYLVRTDVGKRITDARELFVGKHVYNAFAGYAHAQLEKMETRDPAELREYLAITAELKRRGEHPNHKGEKFVIPVLELHGGSGIERDVMLWGTEKLWTRLRRYQKKGENIGYLGEKRKQLVLEHGYDTKNAAHLIRLLRMCVEFMDTGELQVHRYDDAKELLAIKRGEWTLERVKTHASDLFANAKAARDESKLPEGPRREEAEALLIDITRKFHA